MMQRSMMQPTAFITIQGGILLDAQNNTWQRNVIVSLYELQKLGIYRFILIANTEDVPVIDPVVEVMEREAIAFDEIITIQTLGEAIRALQLDPEHSFAVGSNPDIQRIGELVGCRIYTLDGEEASSWRQIVRELGDDEDTSAARIAKIHRKTNETSILCALDLDGSGKAEISTGLPFFDHMLHQIFRHGHIDGRLEAQGDLAIDEHHTVEDVAIVFGKSVAQALGEKRGIGRYGYYLLPMDDCLAEVAVDFSGRPWFVWDVAFSRDVVGTFPTELLQHFFKSFSDEAKCNLHMKVNTGNAHHQAEALCKAFGKALCRAIFRYRWDTSLPSTKGVL